MVTVGSGQTRRCRAAVTAGAGWDGEGARQGAFNHARNPPQPRGDAEGLGQVR